MKRKLAVAIGLISMSIPALAQFGSGIVYDPTQSAHAIQQIQQFEQQLQKAEQQIQKAEQIYTTALQTQEHGRLRLQSVAAALNRTATALPAICHSMDELEYGCGREYLRKHSGIAPGNQ